MKAIQYLGPETIRVNEIPEPEAGVGDALIEVAFAGICGTDMTIRGGGHPRARPPLTLGHEISGRLVAIGDGATGLAEGDPVTINPLISCGKCWSCRHGLEHICYHLKLFGIDAPGGMARFLTVPSKNLVKLPPHLDSAKAALAEPLAVGIHATNLGAPAADDKIVVIGAGPIGLVTALCLQRKGVANVLISDVCDFRLALSRKLGFATVDVRSTNLLQQVREWTEGDLVDAVYEASGHPSAMEGITDLVRARGTILMVSVHKGERPMDFRAINFKEIHVLGSRCYSHADFVEAVDALASLPVETLISHRLPVEEGPRGFEIMLEADISCKVLFDLNA